MKKVITIFLSLLAFFFFANTVSAQIVINEVQTAPIAERFMELYNAGSSDIDLTGWYVQRKTATGSSFGSSVTKTKFENKSIKAGGYFLISRTSLSNSDIVVDNMTLTDSNTLRLRDSKGEDVDQIEWGSLNEGESYQKIGSGWTSATPTPGSSHLEVGLPSGLPSGDTESKTKSSEQQQLPPPITTSASSWPAEPQIFARVKSTPRVAVVGADIVIEGEVLGLEKKSLSGARYLWTLGDGGTKEGQKVLYSYNYPGKYVVVLNTSSGNYSASDRVVIEVIPADIEISKVGIGVDSYIEIYNKTKYELNLSQWKLRAGSQFFEIPEDTIILSGRKIIFPPQNTGFNITKNENIELLYPNNNAVFSYVWKSNTQVKITKIDPVAKASTSETPIVSVKAKPVQNLKTNNTKEEEKEVVPSFDVGQQQSANVFTASSAKDTSIYKWLFGVTALAIISILGVLFSSRVDRKALGISKEADEYEIIEDED